MPDGLNIGSGIARGTRAFIENFYQGKTMKHNLQLRKNDRVLDILTRQLDDPNKTYDEQAEIMDQIGSLLNVKADQSLSQMFGLHKMKDQQRRDAQVVDPNNPGSPAATISAGDSSIVGTQGEQGLSTSSQVQGTEIAPKLIRKGTLTPAQEKLQRDLEQRRLINAEDIDKQGKLIGLQAQSQAKVLREQGWEKNGDWFVDPSTQQWTQVWFNPRTNEQHLQALPKGASPLQLELVKEKNKNVPGKLGQMIKVHAIIDGYENKTDPSITETQYKGAKDIAAEFEKTGKLNDAKIAALNAGTYGSKPLTQGQTINNSQEDQKTQLQLEKDFNDATAEANAFLKQRDDIGTLKEASARESEEANKKFDQVSKESTPEDTDYKVALAEKNVKRKKYEQFKTRYDELNGHYLRAQTKASGAEQRRNSFKPSGGISSTGSADSLGLSENDKAIIVKVRAQNPEATNGKSDIEVIGMIQSSKVKR